MAEGESNAAPRPERPEMDARTLLGFNEEPAQFTDGDYLGELARDHEQDPNSISARAHLRQISERFPVDLYEHDGYVRGEDAVPPDVLRGFGRLYDALIEREAATVEQATVQRVQALAEPMRTVVVARYFHFSTERQLGAALGLSTRTVEFLLDAALDQLAPLVEGRGGGHA